MNKGFYLKKVPLKSSVLTKFNLYLLLENDPCLLSEQNYHSDPTWVCKKLQGLLLLFGKRTEVDLTARAAHCSLAGAGELLLHVAGLPPLALSKQATLQRNADLFL